MQPDGTLELEVNGPADHAQAMDAIAQIGDMRKEAMVQRWMREEGFSLDVAPVATRSVPGPVVPPAPTALLSTFAEPQAVSRIDRAVDGWCVRHFAQDFGHQAIGHQ